MSTPAVLSIFATLFLAALAGSLHCIGMCGPILIGFQRAFVGLTVQGGSPVAATASVAALVDGASAAAPTSPAPLRRRRRLVLNLTAYHAGRIWTYAMLGYLAGSIGQRLWARTELLGWQTGVSIALSAAVIFAGAAIMGVIPGLRLDAGMGACGVNNITRRASLAALVHTPGLLPRFLLGALMGLLPCGLIYAMLATAAMLPTPLHAALGMAIFGVGTLPALTLAAAAFNLIPVRLRAQGTRIAAALVILTGGWMMFRATGPLLASARDDRDPAATQPADATPPCCPLHGG